MNLKTNIAGFGFDNCFMNASGARCMTKEELDVLVHSDTATYVTKSSTVEAREGNPLPRYYENEVGSINSMGLPNNGIDFYLNYVIENQKHKPGFISIAGLCLGDNLSMLNKINDSHFQGLVELNLSCPNIAGKPQTAYDFETTKKVLEQSFSIYKKPLGVKLPPYFDEIHFQEMATILNGFPLSFVTCINSIGNALFVNIEEESVVIKPKNGFGGIGGDYIKPTALANVHKFYTLLKPSIDIIGCGGIKNGRDVFEHILCGASMVQIGTQFMKEDIRVFERIKNELLSVMQEKNYTSLDDFKGNLKSL